jgi:hypothetical protein
MSAQGTFFDAPEPKPWQRPGMGEIIENIPTEYRFDGQTYDPDEDAVRLTGQLLAVYDLMKDGLWRPLRLIAHEVGGSEAAVSARLRDCRKPKYGGHTVRRKREGGGLFLYRLEVSK